MTTTPPSTRPTPPSPALAFAGASAGVLALFLAAATAAAFSLGELGTPTRAEAMAIGVGTALLAAALLALFAGHVAARRLLRQGHDGRPRRMPRSRSVIAGVGASVLLLVVLTGAGSTILGALGFVGGVLASAGLAVVAGMVATVVAAPAGDA